MRVGLLFLCQNLIKGVVRMFSDEFLERLFRNEDVLQVPMEYRHVMLQAVADVLEEMEREGANNVYE